MANYWTGFWTEIKGAVVAEWPEIGAQMRAVQSEQIDWKDLMERLHATAPFAPELVPPYAVLQTVSRFDDGYCAGGIVYRVTTTAHYITRRSGTDTSATIEERLKTLQDYMLTHAFTNFQVLSEGLALDVSESQPVNMYFLEQQMPLQAGSLTFDCLIGEA